VCVGEEKEVIKLYNEIRENDWIMKLLGIFKKK
jgi:hypothetical protein